MDIMNPHEKDVIEKALKWYTKIKKISQKNKNLGLTRFEWELFDAIRFYKSVEHLNEALTLQEQETGSESHTDAIKEGEKEHGNTREQ